MGCYIDLFDQAEHAGKLHRLYGPAVYCSLRRPTSRASGATSPGTPVESLVIGPLAYVLCFDSRDSARRPAWLVPNQIVRSWSSARLNAAIDSFQLLDHEPTPDDPAYDVYRRRHGR
jgi:hypothetical protein